MGLHRFIRPSALLLFVLSAALSAAVHAEQLSEPVVDEAVAAHDGLVVDAAPDTSADVLRITYSTLGAGDSRLKEIPTEVRLVGRANTGKLVAAQVGLNIALLALGGLSFNTFSKDNLSGDEIADVADRSHLRNPVASDFVQSLQRAVNVHIKEHGTWEGRTFTKSLVVAKGSANLIYENLTGQEEPRYQLVLDLEVWKSQEKKSILATPVVVDCRARSEPGQALSWWADDSYSQVQQQLEQMLQTCQQKVLAQLPRLLEK